MPPSFDDIGREFAEIEGEVDHLRRLLTRLDVAGTLHASQEKWETGHICASATEKIYTGCERVMARLVILVDGAAAIRSDGWHAALLRRVGNPVPGGRDAMISAACQARLDRLRAFRHRERNSYGINLDFQIVVERSREALEGFEMFRKEVTAFLASRS